MTTKTKKSRKGKVQESAPVQQTLETPKEETISVSTTETNRLTWVGPTTEEADPCDWNVWMVGDYRVVRSVHRHGGENVFYVNRKDDKGKFSIMIAQRKTLEEGIKKVEEAYCLLHKLTPSNLETNRGEIMTAAKEKGLDTLPRKEQPVKTTTSTNGQGTETSPSVPVDPAKQEALEDIMDLIAARGLNLSDFFPKSKGNKTRTSSGNGGAKGMRYDMFGHPVTSVLRWMGKQGWTAKEAEKVCLKLNCAVAEATVKIQVVAGRKGKRGEPASLTEAQTQQLETLRS